MFALRGLGHSSPSGLGSWPIGTGGWRRTTAVALPAIVASAPLAAGAARVSATRARLWFWGDQALIDLEARNSLLGRDLLGVYDRYGWHHLGPVWLWALGLARWVGGGSPRSLVVGSYGVEVLAVVCTVVAAARLLPARSAWWTALVVLGFEWAFGADRLGSVWAPYAIALPAALMVVLVALGAVSAKPWPPTVGAGVCASFLCQTDISTVVVVVALLALMPVLRALVQQVLSGRPEEQVGPTGGLARARADGFGWRTPHWPVGVAVLVAVLAAMWSPSLVQQFASAQGNITRVVGFMLAHQGRQQPGGVLGAVDKVFGAFPLGTGAPPRTSDADPAWLVAGPGLAHPWYALYVLGLAVLAGAAYRRRRPEVFALACAAEAAVLGAGLSGLLVYGPLYPYIVLWTGALVLPAWVAVVAFFGPSARPATAPGPRGERALAVPGPLAALTLLAGAAMVGNFLTGPVPGSGAQTALAESSWRAVSAEVTAGPVRTVLVDIPDADDMPVAAAIADRAARYAKRVELNRAALYFLDPSFAPRSEAQLEVVVCCGREDGTRPPAGAVKRGAVDGQGVYTLSPPSLPGPGEVAAPGPRRARPAAPARGSVR